MLHERTTPLDYFPFGCIGGFVVSKGKAPVGHLVVSRIMPIPGLPGMAGSDRQFDYNGADIF